MADNTSQTDPNDQQASGASKSGSGRRQQQNPPTSRITNIGQTTLNLSIDITELEKESDDILADNPRRYQGYVPPDKSDAIIQRFEKAKGFNSSSEAFVAIAILLQYGATNSGGADQIEVKYKGITAKARDLHNAIERVDKKITARQFARTHANAIQEIGHTLGIPGDLAKKRALEVATQSAEEASWCSNFQTQNPACPDTVRQWLVANFKSRFQK